MAWLLFMIAGAAFWVGGRAISEFTQINRALAEVAGICLAVVSGALGLWANSAGKDLEDGEEQ